MVKRIIGWFVLVPLCAILVVFALANRHMVSVRFDPMSPETPLLPHAQVPLFIVIYGMLTLGVILGGIAVWFAQGRYRKERRRFRKEAEKLSGELVAARKAARGRSQGAALLSADDILDDT